MRVIPQYVRLELIPGRRPADPAVREQTRIFVHTAFERNCCFSNVDEDRLAEKHAKAVEQLARAGPPEARSTRGVLLHPRLSKMRRPSGHSSEGPCLAEEAPAHTGVDGPFHQRADATVSPDHMQARSIPRPWPPPCHRQTHRIQIQRPSHSAWTSSPIVSRSETRPGI